jgi:hypothetical protein
MGHWWWYVLIVAVSAGVKLSLRPKPMYCWCGHSREDHRHYRGGSDCGTCGDSVCPRFNGERLKARW